ncbi:MAG: histidine kinase dimerization/phospho-acceptor domain-containing protein, partial [Gemmatimonadota bacterium]|nr:histidine kinase dimerization/phospho-acceptor domain-containing protein [Gemmatimonadota bacterium]
MTAFAASPALDVRTRRLLAWFDAAAIAWTVTFVFWLLLAGDSSARAPLVDMAFFGVLGGGVAAAMVGAALRMTNRRDRTAWLLMATACLVRVFAGALWRILSSLEVDPPSWFDALSVVRCLLDVACVAWFASAPRVGRDRVRLLLDAATVGVGVAVVEGYFALAPALLEPANGTPHGLADLMVLLTGGFCAFLAGLLYLRRADAGMRDAALFLLLGFSMQAVPDALQWNGSQYAAGATVTLWWWAVWLAKLGAARAVLSTPKAVDDRRAPERYRSGVVPYLFLAAANVALWLALDGPDRATSAWMVGAVSVLTAMLVMRHVVEQREQAALARAQHDQHRRFGALVEHSYDAVILVLPDGGASYISPTTRRHLGDDPAYEAPWGLMTAVHPEDAPALRRILTQPENASQMVSCRVRGPQGGWRTFALRIVDLRADARVGAIAIHGHDVTREAALARRLHETAEAEALGVFASGLAHDLNNVLSAISTHVELLLQDVPAESSAAQELRAIERAVARGVRLTRALLGLSRRKTPALELVDVRALVAGLAPGAIVNEGAPLRARLDRASVGHALNAVLGPDATG